MSTPALWRDLRRFTTARVALGRDGHGQPTSAHLTIRRVVSEAPDRHAYLLRPDLGRSLRAADRDALLTERRRGCLALVIADGLCASGVQIQAPAVLASLLPRLRAAEWEIGPVVIARQARVALGDEIGEALGAAVVAVLIGERPGLSSLDSIGIYLTWAPRRGRTDAERNCISNIRAAGLKPSEAAGKLLWLLAAARRLGATGVALKDEQPAQLEGSAAPAIEPS